MTRGSASAEELFAGSPAGLAIHDRVAEVVGGFGDVECRASRSQVAFRHGRGFAYVWRPGRYVRSDVPAVLSIALPHQAVSPRFKEVVHPSPHVWMHHLEIDDVDQVDDQVQGWLREAWAHAAR